MERTKAEGMLSVFPCLSAEENSLFQVSLLSLTSFVSALVTWHPNARWAWTDRNINVLLEKLNRILAICRSYGFCIAYFNFMICPALIWLILHNNHRVVALKFRTWPWVWPWFSGLGSQLELCVNYLDSGFDSEVWDSDFLIVLCIPDNLA